MGTIEIISEIELEAGSSFVTSKAALKRVEDINAPCGDAVILELEVHDRRAQIHHVITLSEEDLWKLYNWLDTHLPGEQPVKPEQPEC